MRGADIVLVYVDNCIIIGDSMEQINELVYSMQHGLETFILMDECGTDMFPGIKIKKGEDGEFELCQPSLID